MDYKLFNSDLEFLQNQDDVLFTQSSEYLLQRFIS